MDLGIFKNKFVIIGGVAIGALLLVVNKSSAGQGVTGQAFNNTAISGVSPYTSAVMAFNTVAAQEVTKQAAVAAQVAINKSHDNVSMQVATLNALSTMDSNAMQVAKQQFASEQGIIQAQIAANSNVQIDISNNTARLGMAQEQTSQVAIQSNANVKIAHYQAKAAKTAAIAGAIGSVAGAFTKVAASSFL